jgi:hypothetical protein
MQVDVMIVQSRDDGAVGGVEHPLAFGGSQALGHFQYVVVRPDVDHGPIEQRGSLYQHGGINMGVST